MCWDILSTANPTIYSGLNLNVDSSLFTRPAKTRKQLKVNLVQLRLDWVSLPNVRNGTYLGNPEKSLPVFIFVKLRFRAP